MKRMARMADVANLLVLLQGCMKKPVVGRAGGLACGKSRNKGGVRYTTPVLSGREPEIRKMLAEGVTITSMADKLRVARKTLRKHIELKRLRDNN